MKKEWFKERRKGARDIIEGALRDLQEVDGAPKKEIESILNFLYEIGFLEREWVDFWDE